MASYTTNHDGTISLKKSYAIVKLDKDRDKMELYIYSESRILLSTYSKKNVFECNGTYGFFDGTKNIEFHEVIKDAINKALLIIENKYPKYKLSSIIKQC